MRKYISVPACNRTNGAEQRVLQNLSGSLRMHSFIKKTLSIPEILAISDTLRLKALKCVCVCTCVHVTRALPSL